MKRIKLDRMEIVRITAGTPKAGFARGRGSRVAMMQPMFLPWLGYFELMDAVDIFIFLDDFQFSRQGWGHRNRLCLSPGRPGILSLPIRHPNNLAATFLDVTPAADQRWHDKLERSIGQSYGRSPHFAEIWTAIGPKLRSTDDNLADFEIRLIETMAKRLDVRTQLRRSSEFGVGLGRSERLVALLDAVGAGTYYAVHGSIDYMRDDGVFPLADFLCSFRILCQFPISKRVLSSSYHVSRLSMPCLICRQPRHARRCAAAAVGCRGTKQQRSVRSDVCDGGGRGGRSPAAASRRTAGFA